MARLATCIGSFDLFLKLFLLAHSSLRLINSSRSIREYQALHPNMAHIYLAHFAIDQSQRGLDGISGYTNLKGPFIRGPAWNKPNNFVLPFGVHYPVNDLV